MLSVLVGGCTRVGFKPLAEDAVVPDAVVLDAVSPDAVSPDAAVPDAAVPDAAVQDAVVPDAVVPDAVSPDASSDSGPCLLSTCTPSQRVVAPDGDTGDLFGHAVAIDGPVAVIGAHGAPIGGIKTGAVYIYRFDGAAWKLEEKLNPPGLQLDDRFGRYVDIQGDVIVVGADGDSQFAHRAGAAYVFRFNGTTWVQEQRLTQSSPAAWRYFGETVAIWGDRILIGCRFDGTQGANSGSATMFHYDGDAWSEEAFLLASDGAVGDHFGSYLDLHDTQALITAELQDSQDEDAGAVYRFELNGGTWTEREKLVASDGSAGDEFGVGLSMASTRAIIGAHRRGPAALTGTAYAFEDAGSAWTENIQLHPPGIQAGDWVGRNVAIEPSAGHRVLVGASRSDLAGSDHGAAFLYVNAAGAWQLRATFLPNAAVDGAQFGYQLAIFGDWAVIGAPEADGLVSATGAVYFADLSGY
ncbi:MAG: hypothetical protein JRH20_00935 [Deltaproteobacteria bacterium]|nr:hypothetical protein [Deltaproteobacteria bacterium]